MNRALPIMNRPRFSRPRFSQPRRLIALFVVLMLTTSICPDAGLAQAPPTPRFDADVVAKAEQILAQVGLRQSGKTIQATNTADISRALTGLIRSKRELRLVYQDWKTAADQLAALRNRTQQLTKQYGELNLQLARVAGRDTAANNRIVGLLNATTVEIRTLEGEQEKRAQDLGTKRGKLNQAEADYAETVLVIRNQFKQLRDKLATDMAREQVQIALRVMVANAETPAGLTADDVLGALDSRIKKIEQEIFSETIPLEITGGSMMVTVVVGDKPIQMVVDSGASIVSFPVATANALGIVVPPDAREMQMVLADGRTIAARGITIPKLRVGEFEAENVAAAVLQTTAPGAEPLLGMSFLENFRFEINAAERTLKMLRVDAR